MFRNTLLLFSLFGIFSIGVFGQTPLPVYTSFENESTCPNSCGVVCNLAEGFLNDTTDAVDWIVYSGNTPSGSTGPSNDHTLGNNLGKYIFLEGSCPNGLEASLISPYLDLNGLSSPQLVFWYHMYGSDMDSLHIDIDTSGVWENDFIIPWTDNLNAWQFKTVDLSSLLSASQVRIRIRGRTGNGYRSDMALDDIGIITQGINDAGVTALDSVGNVCSGLKPVYVRVSNFGQNQITSITINWLFNGALQNPSNLCC